MAFRYDRGTLRPAKRLDNGMLRVDGMFTRTGVFEYLNPDGSIRREYRPPEEVFKAEALESFSQVPFTNGHPPEKLNSRNWKKYAVGSIGENIRKDEDWVVGQITVYDGDTIQDMENGVNKLSAGYEIREDWTPGVTPWGEPYHLVQRDIRGNHIALVGRARAGDEAGVRMDAIRMDAAIQIDTETELSPSMMTELQNLLMRADAMLTGNDDALAILREDYSPNQARDSRGRFGSGGGGGGAGAATPSGVAPGATPRSSIPLGGKETHEVYQKDGKWDSQRVKEVHEPYFEKVTSGVPSKDAPVVFMTGGGPASGKSSGILKNPESGFPDKNSAAHVDSDGAKKVIPEFNAGIAAGHVGAAAQAHEESSYMSKEAMKKAQANKQDVVLDTVGDNGVEDLSKRVSAMRDRGAKEVHAAYATIDVNEALARAKKRAEDPNSDSYGRVVPESYIRSAHADVARTSVEAMERGVFDSMKFFDTTTRTPKLIASYDKKKGGLKVHDEDGWNAHLSRAGKR